MHLHVAFVPPLVQDSPQVCIVVDVIRASTTLVTLLDRGAGKVLIAGDVASARQYAARHPGLVLAGEELGLAPRGFQYGNSPVELSRADVSGRTVVFVTTNGTAAIHAVDTRGPVLVGALRNAAAVSREAARLARGINAGVTIVCAGREGAFGIDDAYTAGCLIDLLLMEVRPTSHESRGTSHDGPELTDAALAALRLFRSDPDTTAVFRMSAAGRNVIGLGLGDDVTFCAERDRSTAVPMLGRELHTLPPEL
ncbi:MAG TPA: 2-phosphosulfolactate phosphatase [bacterium]|jgi:2-phosphosulfolactate phosphatase|nr:2-phosphosulfolactate phosphatase [bacterium]